MQYKHKGLEPHFAHEPLHGGEGELLDLDGEGPADLDEAADRLPDLHLDALADAPADLGEGLDDDDLGLAGLGAPLLDEDAEHEAPREGLARLLHLPAEGRGGAFGDHRGDGFDVALLAAVEGRPVEVPAAPHLEQRRRGGRAAYGANLARHTEVAADD